MTGAGEITALNDATTSGDASTNQIAISTPADVSWLSSVGESFRHLSHDHVKFDLSFDAHAATAQLRLRAAISLKNKRHKTHIFIYVFVDRIQQLSLVTDSTFPAADKLGTRAHSLHFELEKPPALVVPKDGLTPKDGTSREVLGFMQELAGMRRFEVHFPYSTVSVASLLALCETASRSGKNCLREGPTTLNVARLYGGKGGTMIEHCESKMMLEVSASSTAPALTSGETESPLRASAIVESPPSYDELGPSPPRAQKRRRDGSRDAKRIHPDLEDIFRQGFSELSRQLRCFEQRVDERFHLLDTRLERVEHELRLKDGNLGSRIELVEQHLVGLQERSKELGVKLDASLSELADSFDTQLQDMRREVDDTIDVRLEDEMYVARQQLNEYVEDEINDAEERVQEKVREQLRDALS